MPDIHLPTQYELPELEPVPPLLIEPDERDCVEAKVGAEHVRRGFSPQLGMLIEELIVVFKRAMAEGFPPRRLRVALRLMPR